MYQRFRDSIIKPAMIVDFRNDKVIWVLLYILFFALLLSTRTFIDIATYDGLSVADGNEIVDQIPTLDPDCGFNDTAYVCDTEESTLLYKDQIISYSLDSYDTLDTDRYDAQYNIVIHDDSMHVIVGSSILYEEKLTDLPADLLNFDFSLQTSDPDAFEARIIDAIDAYIINYKPIWGIMLITVDFLMGVILFIGFVLLSAFMMRFRFKEIPYRQMFVMTAYSSTALYLILIFNSLLELHFILVILLIIIAFRQNNQLSYEILRRLRKKP